MHAHIFAMKLRITKVRIACAVALLPVLYVLNAGPMVYCVTHLGIGRKLSIILYEPVVDLFANTPMSTPFEEYMQWWGELPPKMEQPIWDDSANR